MRHTTLLAAAILVASQAGAIDIKIPAQDFLQRRQAAPVVAEGIENSRARLQSGAVAEAIGELEALREASPAEEKAPILIQLSEAYAKAKRKRDAVDALELVARGHVPTDDATRATATMRLGYLKYGYGPTDEALEEFKRLATGEIPAPPEVASKAAQRVAMMMHTKGEALEAISVHEQILRQSPIQADRHYSQLQLAGLYMERAKGNHGLVQRGEAAAYYEASLGACEAILEDPATRPGTRVIAELMYFENHYFLGDFNSAIQLSALFLDRYDWRDPETRAAYARQLSAAQAFRIFSLFRAGQYKDCIAACRDTRAAAWKPAEQYPTFNVNGYTYLYEALSHDRLGNADEARMWHSLGRAYQPDWYDMVRPQVERRAARPGVFTRGGE